MMASRHGNDDANTAATATSPAAGSRARRRLVAIARRLGRIAAVALVTIFASAALLGLYALIMWLRLPAVTGLGDPGDPGATAFMASSRCAAPARTYRPLGEIDPRLACAVVWAEDWRFFHHPGVDWRALEGALETNWALGEPRYGASTLAMQLARNLFLDRDRTPGRKFREIFLARALVARHGHERVLELYLNAAEWAPCVYGAEAAARHYLGHGAGVLDPAEATFLAAMLPRPSTPPGHDAADRRRLVRRQQQLVSHLARAGLMAPAEVRAARAGIFALWNRAPGQGPSASRAASPDWLARTCGTGGHERPRGGASVHGKRHSSRQLSLTVQGPAWFADTPRSCHGACPGERVGDHSEEPPR